MSDDIAVRDWRQCALSPRLHYEAHTHHSRCISSLGCLLEPPQRLGSQATELAHATKGGHPNAICAPTAPKTCPRPSPHQARPPKWPDHSPACPTLGRLGRTTRHHHHIIAPPYRVFWSSPLDLSLHRWREAALVQPAPTRGVPCRVEPSLMSLGHAFPCVWPCARPCTPRTCAPVCPLSLHVPTRVPPWPTCAPVCPWPAALRHQWAISISIWDFEHGADATACEQTPTDGILLWGQGNRHVGGALGILGVGHQACCRGRGLGRAPAFEAQLSPSHQERSRQ